MTVGEVKAFLAGIPDDVEFTASLETIFVEDCHSWGSGPINTGMQLDPLIPTSVVPLSKYVLGKGAYIAGARMVLTQKYPYRYSEFSTPSGHPGWEGPVLYKHPLDDLDFSDLVVGEAQ